MQLSKVLSEYCSHSSIHGFRYCVEQKRHWTERCWWIIAIGVSVWFCSVLVQNVWIKWRDTPVIMAMNEKQLPISTVPFPTVTICPETKVHRSKLDLERLYEVPKEMWNCTEAETARIAALSHICLNLWTKFNSSADEFANASVFDMIEEMAPISGDTIRACRWKGFGDDNTCSDLFAPVLTEEGLCFSFNNLNWDEVYTDKMAAEVRAVVDRPSISNWSLETGYKTEAKDRSYPVRVFSAQKSSALKFKLRTFDEDVEYVCRTLVPGFKIFLHTPGDVLKENDVSIRVPFSEEVQISIKPKLTTTSDGLRKYDTEKRQCYFNSENKLNFFKFYSQGNCEAECLANYTLQKCGCVKFNMPRNESTQICGTSKIECYMQAHQSLLEEDIVDGLTDEAARIFRQECNCLPSCTAITYDLHVDRAKFYWREALLRTLNWTTEEVYRFHMSSVMIYFDHHWMDTLKRNEQYSLTDFLAVCGGLAGLCLGISALSIVECLYFFTLRLYWSLSRCKTNAEVVPVKLTKLTNNNHVKIDIPYP